MSTVQSQGQHECSLRTDVGIACFCTVYRRGKNSRLSSPSSWILMNNVLNNTSSGTFGICCHGMFGKVVISRYRSRSSAESTIEHMQHVKTQSRSFHLAQPYEFRIICKPTRVCKIESLTICRQGSMSDRHLKRPSPCSDTFQLATIMRLQLVLRRQPSATSLIGMAVSLSCCVEYRCFISC